MAITINGKQYDENKIDQNIKKFYCTGSTFTKKNERVANGL